MATAFREAFQLRPVAVKNQVCKFHQLLKQLAFYIVIFSHGDTLVQCDVVLPNKDGPEALGRRARRTGPRDPLLLLGAVCGLDSSSPTATHHERFFQHCLEDYKKYNNIATSKTHLIFRTENTHQHEVVDDGDSRHEVRWSHIGCERLLFDNKLETGENLVDFGYLTVEMILRCQVGG